LSIVVGVVKKPDCGDEGGEESEGGKRHPHLKVRDEKNKSGRIGCGRGGVTVILCDCGFKNLNGKIWKCDSVPPPHPR